MQSLRIKFGERRSDWTFCFCCHVRTLTIALGMYHFLVNVVWLCGLTLTGPQYMPENMDIPELPTPLSEIDDDNFPRGTINIYGEKVSHNPRPLPRSFVYDSDRDWNLSMFFTLCYTGLTLMLLYGAIKKKPSYLMPFFAFQVFNFCISSMATIGYICLQPPNVQQILESNQAFEYVREHLKGVNPQTLSLYVIIALLLAMMLKFYCLGIVWSCYKYLTLRRVATQRTLHFINQTQPDNQNLIHQDLPDYETAIKKCPTPPPSYSAAMLGQPLPEVNGPSSSATTTTSVRQDEPPQPWITWPWRLPAASPATISTVAPVHQV